MAKSTRGGGPSFSDDELQDPTPPEVMLKHPPTVNPTRFQYGTLTQIGGELESVGNNLDQFYSDDPNSNETRKQSPQGPAQTTENHSNQSATETDSTADSTDGSGPETEKESTEDVPPYEEWEYRELQAECKERGLPATGSAESLVAELYAYDEKHPVDD